MVSLVDIRHEASDLDVNMIGFLQEAELPFAVVLTKADKLSRQQQMKQKAALKKQLKLGATCRSWCARRRRAPASTNCARSSRTACGRRCHSMHPKERPRRAVFFRLRNPGLRANDDHVTLHRADAHRLAEGWSMDHLAVAM